MGLSSNLQAPLLMGLSMVCYFPLRASPKAEKNPATGKRGFTFSTKHALIEGDLRTLPCGGCIGCRIDRAEGWAIRSTHEAKMQAHHTPGAPGSAFLTLTYDNEHLPVDNSVRKEVVQDFMKALRYRVGKANPIRYLAAAEYGDLRGRAHFHLLIFGWSFPDRVLYKVGHGGNRLYTSELLSTAWDNGLALVGDVSYQSARYVAGYVMKKIGGDRAEAHYTRLSPVDGNAYRVEPEFQLMSLKPGIGQSFFERFKSDIFPSDQCIIDGHPRKPPRYYEKMLPEPELIALKRARKRRAVGKAEDRTPDRLKVRNEVATLKAMRFERGVD